jgi:hypothetical protein
MQAVLPTLGQMNPFEKYQNRVLFSRIPSSITEKSVNHFLDTLQPPDEVLQEWLETGMIPMWSALSELAFDWDYDEETDYITIARELMPQVLAEARQLAQVYQ